MGLVRPASLALSIAGTAAVFWGSWLIFRMKPGSHRYAIKMITAFEVAPPPDGFINFLNDQRRRWYGVLAGVGLQFIGVILAAVA